MSEDADRTFSWLEEELAEHLERAHARVHADAEAQARGLVAEARRGVEIAERS